MQLDLEESSLVIETLELEARLGGVRKVIADIEHSVAESREFAAEVLGPLDAEVPVDDREDEHVGKLL